MSVLVTRHPRSASTGLTVLRIVTGPLFALCELLFGVLVILGLLTRIGAGWFILDMLGAIMVVHVKNGWSGPGGLEFPVLLLSAAVAVFLAGPGAIAIDNVLAARSAIST
jgi:putative oxidoreductase